MKEKDAVLHTTKHQLEAEQEAHRTKDVYIKEKEFEIERLDINATRSGSYTATLERRIERAERSGKERIEGLETQIANAQSLGKRFRQYLAADEEIFDQIDIDREARSSL